MPTENKDTGQQDWEKIAHSMLKAGLTKPMYDALMLHYFTRQRGAENVQHMRDVINSLLKTLRGETPGTAILSLTFLAAIIVSNLEAEAIKMQQHTDNENKKQSPNKG